MAEAEDILISLEARHARNIYSGVKKVELRRRKLRVKVGDIVWIYEKMPVGSITGRARVSEVHIESPSKIWRTFGAVSGLSKIEFFSYFEDLNSVCVLELSDACQLSTPLPLSVLREASYNFQPPQFFLRLQAKATLLSVLRGRRLQ